MATAPNLKVNIGADTKDFEKGAKSVKQGLRDLEKTGSSALGSLGEAFGVNTGKVGEITSALTGLGAKMQQAGNTGVKAFGSMLSSVNLLGGGIAALGLGVAAAGFKALRDEAENFKSTIDGMNMSMATAAYISTYQQVLHDVNRETGKSVAEAIDQWDRGLARFKSNVGATLAGAFTNNKWYDAFLPTGFIRGWRQVADASKEAEAAAERNAERGYQMADLMKEELTTRNQIKLIDNDIAEQRRVLADTSASTTERAAAEVLLREKIAEKYRIQTDLAQRMYDTQKAMDDEASNTFEQTQKTAELEGRLIDLKTAEENELRNIDRLSRSIATSSQSNAAAWQKAREEAEKISAARALGQENASILSGNLPSVIDPRVTSTAVNIIPSRESTEYFKEAFLAQIGEITVAVGFEADASKLQDISSEVTSLMGSTVSRTSELIGNLIGTLAGGGNAWGDFKDAALSSFGDMAIAVGKIAISAGLASAGIHAALESGQWYLAVAAGAALVALGSAVKSSLSSVANGDYSAGGGGYSSGYSSGSSSGDYETRDVVVNVTGTLEADGDQLIAVIDAANNRNYYTQ